MKESPDTTSTSVEADHDVREATIPKVADQVRDAARRISQRMGYRPAK